MTRTEGRYPTITREQLGPTENLRATVLQRDEFKCLARDFQHALGACTGLTGMASALPDGITPPADAGLNPLYMRTFCARHGAERRAWPVLAAEKGWLIPARVAAVAEYAAGVPVLFPSGRYFLFDDWGDKWAVPLDSVLAVRGENQRWLR